MSKIHFTQKQIELLRNNKYIKNISDKSITYTKEFKEVFLNEYYKNGKKPNEIFIDAGLGSDVLGTRRIKSASNNWRSKSKRLESINDLRRVNSGRIKKTELTKDEIIAMQSEQLRYLKAKNEFLKNPRKTKGGLI